MERKEICGIRVGDTIQIIARADTPRYHGWEEEMEQLLEDQELLTVDELHDATKDEPSWCFATDEYSDSWYLTFSSIEKVEAVVG